MAKNSEKLMEAMHRAYTASAKYIIKHIGLKLQGEVKVVSTNLGVNIILTILRAMRLGTNKLRKDHKNTTEHRGVFHTYLETIREDSDPKPNIS